jgi:hypothetical protein
MAQVGVPLVVVEDSPGRLDRSRSGPAIPHRHGLVITLISSGR